MEGERAAQQICTFSYLHICTFAKRRVERDDSIVAPMGGDICAMVCGEAVCALYGGDV